MKEREKFLKKFCGRGARIKNAECRMKNESCTLYASPLVGSRLCETKSTSSSLMNSGVTEICMQIFVTEGGETLCAVLCNLEFPSCPRFVRNHLHAENKKARFACKKRKMRKTGLEFSPAGSGQSFKSLFVKRIKKECGRRDLNPYGMLHTPLKRARLPVPPLPHADRPFRVCQRCIL